jgi:hypothetical protein
VPAFDVIVTGDPAHVRAAAFQALEARKFRFTWLSEWSAIAERGNAVGNALAGALAPYYSIDVAIMAGHPGQTIVRFSQSNSGWAGGLVGVSKVKKNFEALRTELVGAFQQQGTLVGVQDHP